MPRIWVLGASGQFFLLLDVSWGFLIFGIFKEGFGFRSSGSCDPPRLLLGLRPALSLIPSLVSCPSVFNWQQVILRSGLSTVAVTLIVIPTLFQLLIKTS